LSVSPESKHQMEADRSRQSVGEVEESDMLKLQRL